MSSVTKAGKSEVYRIPPIHYVHILNQNTNVTRTVLGPRTYVLKDHEQAVIFSKNVIIPPRHYALIANPVVVDKDGQITFDKHGAAVLRHGERQIRLSQEPFPLQPGEQLVGKIQALKMLMKNEALRLRCLEDFDTHKAGEEWLFEGPGLYVPNVNVDECGIVKAKVIRENQALQLRATQDTVDRNQNKRVAGEEWLVRKPGPYLPGVFEQVVQMVNSITLTDVMGVHMRALSSFTDVFGTKRSPGQEWLITKSMTESYIPSVNERKIADVPITILSSREYCVILNPFDDKSSVNILGAKKSVVGPSAFFLRPNERLAKGVEKIYVLEAEEGLIVRVEEQFGDRMPGDRFMVTGPCEYVPPCQVTVEDRRRSMAMASDEGVYVRNLKSGEVRAVIGETLMLNENEELWEKPMPKAIEELLETRGTFTAQRGVKPKKRDRTKIVTYRVPHNSAVQIYDYKERKPRVVFGPKLVMLKPNEMFTPLSLSGGKPKKPNAIRALHLLLGPDFSTDIITVETSDHARLDLRVSYNWKFDLTQFSSKEDATGLFSVADFVGDMCNAMASRIRGAIASKSFDEFHKTNATIIRTAIFGKDKDKFEFAANGLVIYGIDIQSIEPVDAKTRQALQKAVQLAIQITTDSQEQSARQEAERMEQEAAGKLQRAVIGDDCTAEKSRKKFKELVAQTKAVQTAGQAKAEAQSIAEAALIGAKASVEEARLLSEAKEIQEMAAISAKTAKQNAELKFLKLRNEIEVTHKQTLADVETRKFAQMIAAVGPSTIENLALSRSTNQVSMLKDLGINSTLITDGKKPINFLQTAQLMVQRRSDAAADDEDDDDY